MNILLAIALFLASLIGITAENSLLGDLSLAGAVGSGLTLIESAGDGGQDLPPGQATQATGEASLIGLASLAGSVIVMRRAGRRKNA